MKKYTFFYDESEHSRKINFNTISAYNYYDNFVVTIIGCNDNIKDDLFNRYTIFEDKYSTRKSHGELKSTSIKQKQLLNGFASLNKQNVEFLNDYFSLFNDNLLIYFSFISKTEYIIDQLFDNYNDNYLININSMKYSIVKAILLYKPELIMKSMYTTTDQLVKLLKNFFKERIKQNNLNYSLKHQEIHAFSQILYILDEVSQIKTIDWNYNIAFIGFKNYLEERQINNYSLLIDKEGENQNTLNAAHNKGILNSSEEDSINSCGIRMADMLAGILSKLAHSIHDALSYNSKEETIQKKILPTIWFELNEKQFNLYKKLYYIICEINNSYHKHFSGVYRDDLICLISLLQYINNFRCLDDMKNISNHSENFNDYCCENLSNYHNELSNYS